MAVRPELNRPGAPAHPPRGRAPDLAGSGRTARPVAKGAFCAFRIRFATLRSHFVTGCIPPRPNRETEDAHAIGNA
ncbi:hypothetical protein B4N89_10385 [Embleya scabrispora]|uniref:Uncharacterized protein n=1 Tax=Embleya scabrispora TaxID=159449 RepID=A0A1T3NXC5_9ACTN|nr:hypothetical protein B4N89_10385 [Embleya scabrispora]